MLYLCPGPASKGERVVLHQDEELLPERIELQLGAFWLWSWQGQGQWTRIIMVSCFDEQATVARVRWSWKLSAFGGEHSRDFSFIEVGIADYSGRSIMKVEVSRAQYLYTLPQTPTHLPREQSHRHLCASGPPLMLHPAFVAMFGTFGDSLRGQHHHPSSLAIFKLARCAHMYQHILSMLGLESFAMLGVDS